MCFEASCEKKDFSEGERKEDTNESANLFEPSHSSKTILPATSVKLMITIFFSFFIKKFNMLLLFPLKKIN